VDQLDLPGSFGAEAQPLRPLHRHHGAEAAGLLLLLGEQLIGGGVFA